MHINQAETNLAFTVQAAAPTFSSVWGNEMQREDFLALAAGVRQFSASQADSTFTAPTSAFHAEPSMAAAG